ncbi:endo-1,4-beta-xylanase A precursor [Gracilibacillus boraciitolerans JCM 21714]|uniref:Endo-1,4-beta-xylanase A n=1 Tax=Gracilibacillus boraciitolerans JCM 21714 TaxID=1298598 RepID=W4VMA1_9BACI|nr:endo-1,4-beta-xylanase A precursor [Gracilibacillus boraciitolerans JCM 21714]
MNQNFKQMVSILLVFILLVQPALSIPAVHAAAKEDIPVLLYHRIMENPTNEWTDTSITKFSKTMEYLHDNGYQTLTAEQYVSILEGNETAPEKPILLTFDDATPDFITNALPILEKYDMKAVLFVISDWIDKDYSMSKSQLDSLIDKPNISIQNHTFDHSDKKWGGNGVGNNSTITEADATEQIEKANLYLKELTGQDPILMAYPYGSYNDTAKTVNEAQGIKYAFKVGYPNDGDYAMGRHYIMMDTTLAEIADWIGGPPPETETEPEKEPEESVYYESFMDGQGLAIQSGGVTLTPVTDKTFEGNDDGAALYATNRNNDYDAIDFNFADIGLENGKTYTATVTGYVDSEEAIPDGGQAVLSTVDSYTWLSNVNFVAGKSFTLTSEFKVNTANDSKLRVQSSDAGKTVPFYIGEIVITEKATPVEEEEEEPDQDRPDAKEFTTIDFEDQTASGFEGRNGGGNTNCNRGGKSY